MKNICRKVITFILVLALMFTFSTSALAAPTRNQGTIKYLSEVALIEAASDEEAQKVLTELKKEENGSFTDMIALDLNKGGQKKIYLAYKTSTNVDDAITDLAVMNMNGDFSVGNYEKLLSDTLDGYNKVTEDYRIMAKAFAEKYAAGSDNANLAYRQMNYYYLEENGIKTYMGDYMLNFPTTSEGFSNILFKGNLNIIANLRTLLAMGIGDITNPISTRIADAYAQSELEATIYQFAEYENIAKVIKEDLENMKKDINNLEAEIAEVKKGELDADEKEFVIQTLQNSLDASKAYLELLKEIPMGDTTLGDYVMNTAVLETTKLYPLVYAGTDAEKLLMEYHSLYSLLLYTGLGENMEDLDAALAKVEAEYEPISVYHGVQNDLTAGTIGVTGDAEAYSGSSGKNFLGLGVDLATIGATAGLAILGAGGLASTVGGVAYMIKSASANIASNATKKIQLAQAVAEATQKVNHYQDLINSQTRLLTKGVNSFERIMEYEGKLATAQTELTNCTNNLKGVSSQILTGGQIFLGSFLIVTGIVMMGISIWQLTELYNKYEITYTDIPDNMVDVVSYDDGDRFVNYKNVPAYYFETGALKHRENDLNAYSGSQWISLYYTKNYEAGYCLTSSPDLIATETAKTGYTPVHHFGRSEGYNTNAYCNRENADSVYLAFKYSTNQKSAVTDIPDIVGSLFSTGMIALSAFAGLVVGITLMAVITRKGKKVQ